MIKVGFCVSYDWELLKKSLPRVYAYADKICFSIDKNRRSWNHQPYTFDEAAFATWLAQADPDKKIDLYEDDFSIADLSPMQNDSRQRMLMAKRLGEGGWHVQVDSDEYFLDFEGFTRYLKKLNPNPTGKEKPVNVCVCWIPLIRRVANGYIYVDFKERLPEVVPAATTMPQYERARHSGHFNMLSPYYVIHETWARSEDELWFKMNNWGHVGDELRERNIRQSYYNLWKILDEYNYQYLSNFHPAQAEVWPWLGFCEGDSVETFIKNYKPPVFPLSPLQQWMRNNRNVARMKMLYAKLFS